MNENENMVQDEGLASEDLLEEAIVEEPQDDSISLEEALNEESQPEGSGEPENEQPGAGGKEPGYVQKRISKAVQKAVAEARAQMQAEFDAQMAPLREYQMDIEAQKLVNSGKVKDLETAKELVRYRQGQPQAQAARDSQPQDGGRPDPAVEAKLSMLQHQADRIAESGGPDVIAEFRSNPDVKQKIISGEWDFEDVASWMKQRGNSRKPPSPTRSPNGANSSSYTFDFANMSSEQFAKIEKRIQEGARISLKN